MALSWLYLQQEIDVWAVYQLLCKQGIINCEMHENA